MQNPKTTMIERLRSRRDGMWEVGCIVVLSYQIPPLIMYSHLQCSSEKQHMILLPLIIRSQQDKS